MVGSELPPISVGEFVALTNQALEHVFPSVLVVGELTNFKVSKNRWVYFDLKDDEASVRCFGTVYVLPGPLEEGMLLEVRATPRLHPAFGFSLNLSTVRPVGEGAIRQAAALLETKLAAEGLFAPERKRLLPYPPQRVGLVTSVESAAYADFIKIVSARWPLLRIELLDVQVQGEPAPRQLTAAVQWFNEQAEPPDVLVVIRGGGSADDLVAFSNEQVVRAVAASRVPTLVAIGHEVDVSLAELAADQRASTPSNAAELLVPDRREILEHLSALRQRLNNDWQLLVDRERQLLSATTDELENAWRQILADHQNRLQLTRLLADALSPDLALARGFAIVYDADGQVVRRASQVTKGAMLSISISDAELLAHVENVSVKQGHGHRADKKTTGKEAAPLGGSSPIRHNGGRPPSAKQSRKS